MLPDRSPGSGMTDQEHEFSHKPRRWRGVQGSGFRVHGLPEGILSDLA
jgi:hypothetical protein